MYRGIKITLLVLLLGLSYSLNSEDPKKQEPKKVKSDTITIAERKVDSTYIEQKEVAAKLDSLIMEKKKEK